MKTSPPAPLRNKIPSSDLNTVSGEGDNFVSEPLVAYARALRKNQTKAEEIMWNLLRNRKLKGFKFRRQHPVAPLYILDFYCVKSKIAVELDGKHHNERQQQEYDTERTNILKQLGITVIRFTNIEVMNNSEYVLDQVLKSCNDSLPSPDK
jgi:very-short-patch-repair endonuclease